MLDGLAEIIARDILRRAEAGELELNEISSVHPVLPVEGCSDIGGNRASRKRKPRPARNT